MSDRWRCPGCGTLTSDPRGHVQDCDKVDGGGNALPIYEVIVGNIGCVYRGSSRNDALDTYEEYEADSRELYGRAAGEPVTLMKDGEPIREYAGTLEEE